MNILRDRLLKIKANYVNFTSCYSNFSETDIPQFQDRFNYKKIYAKVFAFYINTSYNQRTIKLWFEKHRVPYRTKKLLRNRNKIKIEIRFEESQQCNKKGKKHQNYLFRNLLFLYYGKYYFGGKFHASPHSYRHSIAVKIVVNVGISKKKICLSYCIIYWSNKIIGTNRIISIRCSEFLLLL